ncbi:hypothetical protein FOZ62_023413 [Perkinsus olseni]|uniref:Uncharacterized protein n=1 Tax=Perkinsus olseni TaxID=32597 RepID=A0A7J6SB33_PEROL|nr:hypothetical protein FOZ62_023413 [Perkinsus olseni]
MLNEDKVSLWRIVTSIIPSLDRDKSRFFDQSECGHKARPSRIVVENPHNAASDNDGEVQNRLDGISNVEACKIRAKRVPGKEWCEYSDPKTKSVISVVKTKDGVKIEGKCWKLGKMVEVEEDAPTEVVRTAKAAEAGSTMKCESVFMSYSTATATRPEGIAAWVCDNVKTPKWWKDGIKERKAFASTSNCVLVEHGKTVTVVQLATLGKEVVTWGTCPERQRPGRQHPRNFRFPTPPETMQLGKEMLQLNHRLECSQLVGSWVSNNVTTVSEAVKEVCSREIMLPKWLEIAREEKLFDEKECRVWDSNRQQELVVERLPTGGWGAKAKCYRHTGVNQRNKPLLDLRISSNVEKNFAGAGTCIEALSELAPSGVITVPHALSYICHVNLPASGQVQWQTQVRSAGGSCSLEGLDTSGGRKASVKISREVYASPRKHHYFFSLLLQCPSEARVRRVAVPSAQVAKLQHNARWYCGSVLAPFLMKGRFTADVTPDGFITDMCQSPEFRNMTADELEMHNRKRQELRAIQDDYVNELRRRHEAEMAKRKASLGEGVLLFWTDSGGFVSFGLRDLWYDFQSQPTVAPVVRGPSVNKHSKTQKVIDAKLRRGEGTHSCHFESGDVKLAVSRRGGSVTITQAGCPASSKSSSAAPSATAAAMARGDLCGKVLATLASTNQKKSSYASAVCRAYFG